MAPRSVAPHKTTDPAMWRELLGQDIAEQLVVEAYDAIANGLVNEGIDEE